MVEPKLVKEEYSATVEYHLLGKRGLIKTVIFGNVIFFLTIVFGNILSVFSIYWVIVFYILAILFVYADYKYGKRVGRLTLVANKYDVGIYHSTGEWLSAFSQVFPLTDVKKIVFHEPTFSLNFLVNTSVKKYNLNPDIPVPFIAELLEITADRSGIPCYIDRN